MSDVTPFRLSSAPSLGSPPNDQADAWLFQSNELAAQTDSLRGMLSIEELKRAARFVSVTARERFVVGRSVLRALLGAYLNQPASTLELSTNTSGKPRLADRDNPLRFNLAHSGDWALIGIATGGEIGVDIERHRSIALWQAIAERHYSDREQATLKSLSSEEQQELFFRIWTRKETALKWHGAGLQMPLSSVEVPLERQCREWVALPASGERCWLESIDAPAGYSAALAVSHPVVDVIQREVQA